jgi:anti-sigma-K factor RskA
MNLEHLQKKLLAAARATPPDDRVPYAFEQRILARLAERPATDVAALWARALWRAAVPCVAVTLLFATLSFVFVSSDTTTAANDDVSEQFEQALLASVDSLEELP